MGTACRLHSHVRHCYLAKGGLLFVALLSVSPAFAQLADIPGLTPAQREAAQAGQDVYQALRPQGEQGELPARQQVLFNAVEAAVHTANELFDVEGEPTARSLRYDNVDALIEVLDWVANEEVGSGSGLAQDTAYAQFAHVIGRLSMLQAGGVTYAGSPGATDQDGRIIAFGHGAAGGGAGDLVSRWGGFAAISYGAVKRDPTDRENAYDADRLGLTVGADYRVTDTVVLGASVGYSRADLDFDSSRSTVGGGIDSDSIAASGYGLYDDGEFYTTGIVTFGHVSVDMDRDITYPSNNPDVPSANETARSSTSGQQLLLGLGAGYQFDLQPMSVGPFARLDVMRIRMDSYRERGAAPYNLRVDSQTIKSLRSTLGVEGSYPVVMNFGALVPGFSLGWHHEFEDDRREVTSRFVADPSGTRFRAEGDRPDRNYYSLNARVTAIFAHGLQAFAEAETILGLRNASAYGFTVGGRMEF